MDRTDRHQLNFFHQSFSKLLSRFQSGRGTSKRNFETIKIARGLILLFFFIGLAWISIEATETEGIARYRRSHWPNKNLWMGMLKEHGLTWHSDLSPYLNFLKSHPHPFAEDPSFWVTKDGCSVLIPKIPGQNKPEFWSCSSLPSTAEWLDLGSGLVGVEKLAAFMEKNPIKFTPKPKVRTKEIDPKEFHY